MAYAALIERTVALPRARVYARLVDFGALKSLAPDEIETCELKGSGVGAIRHVTLKGAPGVLHERLESAVENRVMSYSVINEVNLPLDRYHSVVVLDDAPNGGTLVRWGSNWIAKGAPDADVKAMLEGLYGRLIDGIVRLG
jgi:hypothetical protein